MKKLIAFFKDWRNQLVFLKWISRHTRPFLPQLGLLLGLSTISSAISVGLAFLVKAIIDHAQSRQPLGNMIILYIVVFSVSMVVQFCNGILSTLINERFSFGIRSKVYNSVLNTFYEDISRYHSGDILTRLTSDIDIVAAGIAEIIPSIFSLAITFIIAFVALATQDLGFAVFALILGPLTAVVAIVTGRLSKRVQIKVRESESAYKSEMQENIENVMILKAFEGQSAAGKRLEELRNDRLHWIRKRQKINSIASASLSGMFQLSYIGTIAYCANQLALNQITFGTLQLFQSLIGQIQSPLVGLGQLVPRLVSILASSGRIMELDGLPEENMAVPRLESEPLNLAMQQVNFGYNDDLVLSDASLTIRSGEFVALMGDSGIGKTTLIRLILSFYHPQSGHIELRDHLDNTAEVDAGTRHYIAYVPQGNTLMSGTIADNLKTGRADATEAEMWEVLRVVAADEFVRQTPSGLYTRIGERGHGLSEGQAQRIAIARALIKNAPLLILDEATSALDEPTERAVLQHLNRRLPRPTCIIITHRRSILQYCERCLVIRDRQVGEEAHARNGSC